jgi:hypothetical protein
MPTRRTPRNRDLRPQITPELALKFRALCKLEETAAADASVGCGGKAPGRGCGTCPGCRRIAIRAELVRHYDIAPWMRGLPTDFELKNEVVMTNEAIAASWAKDLEEAIAEARLPHLPEHEGR